MRNILELVEMAASRTPDAEALVAGPARVSYQTLARSGHAFGRELCTLGITSGSRVAVFLDKRVETPVSMLGAAAAGCVFVPVNPLLKPHQVRHILRDCGAQCLVTTAVRAQILGEEAIAGVRHVILADDPATLPSWPCLTTIAHRWPEAARHTSFAETDRPQPCTRSGECIDTDLAAILYTSGSTGLPKGVMLSHRNLLEGAWSVAHYLHHVASDRILAVLPVSFDAGLSQLTSAWVAGATAILVNYLGAQDVTSACERERITAITGVPPLWMQLARATWSEAARAHLRYFANTGGRLPVAILHRLRALFPQASPYLMYGLTEAFRSTFLDPREIDRRPDSIGKAVPNARILVVREDGCPCAPDETGELVHIGACVTLGYWNDAARTAQRYRPSPAPKPGGAPPDMAVWSGDLVRSDADGFLYFVARNDAQIKSSGYRVSPEEIEEIVHASGLVTEAVAIGVPDVEHGEAIVLLVTAVSPASFNPADLRAWCMQRLPPYMVPQRVIAHPALPRNPNGKFDRTALRATLSAKQSGALGRLP